MSRALLLTGGPGHPPEASVDALGMALAPLGVDLDVHTDIPAGLDSLDPDRHTLLIVNALRFSMADPKYDATRAAEAFELDAGGRGAIAEWSAGGGAILGLHTGVLSFDTWPAWAELLGARWVWGTSHHPPLGPVTVEIGETAFEVVDECYRSLDLDPAVDVVARSGDGDPLAWINPTAPGPVAVDLLGHDGRSLTHPGHVDLLRTLVRHLLEPTHG